MKFRLLAAAGVAAAAVSFGLASASPFDGGYLGISAGDAFGGKARSTACGTPQNCNGGSPGSPLFFPAAGGSVQQSYSGLAYGGHIGFNHVFSPAMGAVMLGIEVGAGSGSFSQTSTNPFGALTVGAVETVHTKVQWVGTITPRLGFVWGGNALYVKGGLAFGDVVSSLANTGGTWGAVSFTEKATHVGHTLGAGWENAHWAPWVWGIEYNYVDLGRQRYGGEVTPANTWSTDYQVKTHYGELSARLSVRF